MNKALVLLSGGLDSAVSLSIAVKTIGAKNIACLSFFYGQKHQKEIECSKRLANYYGCPHNVIRLDESGIFNGSRCPLLSASEEEIPEGSYAEQAEKNESGIVATYVPFRNGLFLASAASKALSLFPDDDVSIYIGVHADDVGVGAYADCSVPFVSAMNAAIREGTYGKVSLVSPLVRWTKARVVEEGIKNNVPFALTWSCYKGGEKPCGKCGTCIDRAKAFAENGMTDPALEN